MNLISGYPYSLMRAGIPYDYPRLLKEAYADVVILGGGISGALAAHFLQRKRIWPGWRKNTGCACKADSMCNCSQKKELKEEYGLIAPLSIVSSLAAQTNAYTFTHALHQYNIT